MAKYLAQLIIAGSQVVGRAFIKALREEIKLSQDQAASRGGAATSGAGDQSRSAAVSNRLGMTVQEAKQILNITSSELNEKEIQEKFNHLFKMNDKHVGGSTYLQSKVVRAKERLDEERMHTAEKHKTRRNVRSSDSESSSP